MFVSFPGAEPLKVQTVKQIKNFGYYNIEIKN
jgi:hypothetical protein